MTQNQLDELRKGISTTNGIICSVGVANALKQYANFKDLNNKKREPLYNKQLS